MSAATVRNVLRGSLSLGLLCLASSALSAQAPPISAAQIHSNVATTLCAPPAKPGVTVCYPQVNLYAPNEIASPFQLVAVGTGPHGPAARMELWIDGTKNRQVAGNLIDQAIAMPTDGHNHVATVVAVDGTGAYVKSAPFTLIAESSSAGTACAPPTTPGVNVCTPAPNSCATNPFFPVVAASTGASGAVSRTEVWINGQKLNDFPGAYINTNLSVSPGNVNVTVIEIDDAGNYIKSPVIPVPIC